MVLFNLSTTDAIRHACWFRFEITTKLLEDLAQTIDCIHKEIGQYLIQVNNYRRFHTSSCKLYCMTTFGP